VVLVVDEGVVVVVVVDDVVVDVVDDVVEVVPVFPVVPVLPLPIAAVAMVCAAALVQVIGMSVDPSAIVRLNGLPEVNWGSATLSEPLVPAVMLPLCVACTTMAALVGYVLGTVNAPLTLSDGEPEPLFTVSGTVPEKPTESPAVVKGSSVDGKMMTIPKPASGPFRRFTPPGLVDTL
jgi:hypothetical protein